MADGIDLLASADEVMMRRALAQAAAASARGEVPVGAVLVADGEVIGSAHNQREGLQDPTAHAEILAITQAASALGSWRLSGSTLYVTLEPCAMCAGAIVLARIERLVFGAKDPKAGACGSVLDVLACPALNHKVRVEEGLLATECAAILSDFFANRRMEAC
ncbi:MAG: tRNA adenosine(34) deaminase TadA [Planctomycetota bacterium]